MKLNNATLIDSLMSDVRRIILQAEKLRQLPHADLLKQPHPSRWSVAQVIEHLNFYSKFYLKAIDDKLHTAKETTRQEYAPGWFGEYFTKMMRPKDENTVKNKMKAMKSALPAVNIDVENALDTFLEDQHALIDLLHRSRRFDLGGIRVPTSLTSLVALKLGDTFRFFIAHEQRHFVQIKNTLGDLGVREMEENVSKFEHG